MKRTFTGDSDGVNLGANVNDPIGFYGNPTVPQRALPTQAPLFPAAASQVVTYQQTLTPAAGGIATISASEAALTIGTTAGKGVLSTDFVAAINKPTSQAGLGVASGRVSAANTVALTYSNPTGAALTPTASQIYNVTVLRGVPVISQTLTPAAVGAGKTSEQTFTLAPTAAAGTAVINSAGQVSGVLMTSAGANYTTPPVVVFNYGLTAAMVPSPNSTAASVGSGATGLAIMSSTGTVLGVQITNPGIGYGAAPTVTFLGGNHISPGMMLMVNKPTCDVGLSIGNCRIVAPNQIAIEYVNPTAATITPTSEAYSVAGLHSMAVSNHVISYGVGGNSSLATVAPAATGEQSLTVYGIKSTDIVMGTQKPSNQTSIALAGSRVSADDTLQIGLANVTATTTTPTANEVYGVTVFRQMPTPPFTIFTVQLAPTSVAAHTCAEQTFTVPGLPFSTQPSTVAINKPSYQSGLAIAGVRVSAQDTLAINFENITAAAIIPTTEIYTIGCFNAVGPGGGVPGNWVALASGVVTPGVNLMNELQQTLSTPGTGLMKGSA